MPLQTRNVFIDTQSFERSNFEFESRTLQAFREICKDGGLNYLATTIVVHEVKAHINERIKLAFSGIKEFRRKARILANSTDVNIKALFAELDEAATRGHAVSIFDDFLNDCGATVLDMKGLDAEVVIEDYFNIAPPFRGKKKFEFPDAFNMLAVQACIGKEESVYIVSEDTDLIAYCNVKQNFIHIDTLAKLLDLYNEHDAQRSAFIRDYVDEHTDEIKDDIVRQLEDAGAYNSSTWDDSHVEQLNVINISDFDLSIIYLDDTSCQITIDTTAEYSVTVTGPDTMNGIYDKEAGRVYALGETTRESDGEIDISVEVELNFRSDSTGFVMEDAHIFVEGAVQGFEVSVEEWEDSDYR
ncbi:PIN domain-containing protein [Lysobacter sp. A378]